MNWVTVQITNDTFIIGWSSPARDFVKIKIVEKSTIANFKILNIGIIEFTLEWSSFSSWCKGGRIGCSRLTLFSFTDIFTSPFDWFLSRHDTVILSNTVSISWPFTIDTLVVWAKTTFGITSRTWKLAYSIINTSVTFECTNICCDITALWSDIFTYSIDGFSPVACIILTDCHFGANKLITIVTSYFTNHNIYLWIVSPSTNGIVVFVVVSSLATIDWCFCISTFPSTMCCWGLDTTLFLVCKCKDVPDKTATL